MLFTKKEMPCRIALDSLTAPFLQLQSLGEYQRIVYNGHKRVHSLKFQLVVIPNGMIANLYVPVGKFIIRHSYSPN